MDALQLLEETSRRHQAENAVLAADLKKFHRNTKRWMIFGVLAILFSAHLNGAESRDAKNAQPQSNE